MKIKEFDEKYGKPVLIGAVILIWIAVVWSIFVNGYLITWYRWSFPAKLPPFLDFRLIPGAAQTFRRGFDPALINPYDPRGRHFNYPKIWYLLFYTGITKDDTIWICIVLLVLFFLIVFAFPQKIRVRDAIILLGIIFSSASMLLYERGNVDLIIFILSGLTILCLDRFPGWSVGILSVAAMLKLFPFFGVIAFFQENKTRFFRLLFTSTLIFLVYIALSFESLVASWKLTDRGTTMSYGVYVIFDFLHAYVRYYLLKVMPESQIPAVTAVAPHLSALLLLILLFFIGMKNRPQLAIISERNLTAFRMGASIYVGTFLLGNNWDYRMVFLIFAAPQITQWLFSASSKYRWLFLGVLTALLISCWGTVIHYQLSQLFGPDYVLYIEVFDETMNWALFAGLTYLLIVSAPEWVWSFNLRHLLKPVELIREA